MSFSLPWTGREGREGEQRERPVDFGGLRLSKVSLLALNGSAEPV